ncbi:MAG: hypothetical protein KBB91_00940 [Candidatus Pacebacteria bacterium]|nr:hypothetical protein [Candidatus Paceibacterota bacterium]MBP9701051.1 hypothetical protein [Candidatus Paceibacterota bacterium]
MKKKLKTILVLVVVVVVIGIGANYFLQKRGTTPTVTTTGPLSSSSKAAGVTTSTTGTSTAVTSEFSNLLSTIKSISIDTTIFSDPSYRSLRDYPVALGTEMVGRPNPFAPVGYDAVPAGTAMPTPVSVETLQPGKVTATTAELGAQAITGGTTQTTIVFEYGTSDLFGSATAPLLLGKNGTALYTVSALTPLTTYYVRAILAQGSITTVGNTMTFTTIAKKP